METMGSNNKSKIIFSHSLLKFGSKNLVRLLKQHLIQFNWK